MLPKVSPSPEFPGARMRSAQMGARKRILDKSDIDSFPFPNIQKLTKEERTEIVRLADMLDGSREKDWKTLDLIECRLRESAGHFGERLPRDADVINGHQDGPQHQQEDPSAIEAS